MKTSPLRKVTLKDLQLFYVVGESSAKRRKKEIIAFYNSKREIKRGYVTLQDLAVYEGYSIDYVMNILN